MSANKQPRRIGEILAEQGFCDGSKRSVRERTVVLGYRAPVWVTVDLASREVSKVEVGDTEVAPERDEHGSVVVVDASDGALPGDEQDAAQIAEGSVWPAWDWAR